MIGITIMPDMRVQKVMMQTRAAILSHLVLECRRRFSEAMRLLDLNEAHFEHFTRPNVDDIIPLDHLADLYDVLTQRYVHEVWDAQMRLFDEKMDQDEFEQRRWTQYAYWALIPCMVKDDAMARGIMRCIGCHPCTSQAGACQALVDAATNMAMPPIPQPTRDALDLLR